MSVSEFRLKTAVFRRLQPTDPEAVEPGQTTVAWQSNGPGKCPLAEARCNCRLKTELRQTQSACNQHGQKNYDEACKLWLSA